MDLKDKKFILDTNVWVHIFDTNGFYKNSSHSGFQETIIDDVLDYAKKGMVFCNKVIKKEFMIDSGLKNKWEEFCKIDNFVIDNEQEKIISQYTNIIKETFKNQVNAGKKKKLEDTKYENDAMVVATAKALNYVVVTQDKNMVGIKDCEYISTFDFIYWLAKQ